MINKPTASLRSPIRVGLVGTGYAAQRRAEAFQADSRSQLLAVVGHDPDKTATFANSHSASVSQDWQTLVQRSDIDLVTICHINRDHGAVARAALEAGKAVIVEYPLCLDIAEGEALLHLATESGLFLHVEHIELLGGLHQAVQTHLPQIGRPTYVRYSTVVPKRPAPQKWTYHAEQFGFPLAGALSRLHRLTQLFGRVHTVACQLQYDDQTAPPDGYFKTCRCVAQLRFHQGVVAEVLYGKGEGVWESARRLEVEGSAGALVFEGSTGELIQPQARQPVPVGGRRGLFTQDTTLALDALLAGKPLYVSPADSLYALRVAIAAQQAAATGETVTVTP